MNTHALMVEPNIPTQRRNRLLDSLDGKDATLLTSHATFVELSSGQCFSGLSNEPTVCFPLTLVASVVQVMADGSRFEVGLIGSEGLIGWTAVLGGGSGPQASIAQAGGGTALVVAAPLVAELCRRSGTLQASLSAFVQTFAVQMSHTIVANLRDGIDRRLARWLAMLHDRVDGDVLAVTHGELASALHVRRASITDTLHVLEGDHVVRCTRGQLAIRDRAALTALAGDCYGPAEASYRAMVADFGKG